MAGRRVGTPTPSCSRVNCNVLWNLQNIDVNIIEVYISERHDKIRTKAGRGEMELNGCI